MEFAEALKNARLCLGLTQRETVELLRSSSEVFSALDEVTLSRWETAKTTPPLSKSIIVLYLLGCKKPMISYVNRSSQREKLANDFERKYLYRHNVKSIKSILDYLIDDSEVSFEYHSDISRTYIDKYNPIHFKRYNQNLDLIIDIVHEFDFDVKLYEFFDSKKNLIGYMIYIIGYNHMISKLLNKLPNYNVVNNSILQKEDDKCLFVISDITATRSVDLLRWKILIKDITHHQVDEFLVKFVLDEGKKIAKNFNMNLLAISDEDCYGEVKLGGKPYNWLLYSSAVVELFAYSLIAVETIED